MVFSTAAGGSAGGSFVYPTELLEAVIPRTASRLCSLVSGNEHMEREYDADGRECERAETLELT